MPEHAGPLDFADLQAAGGADLIRTAVLGAVPPVQVIAEPYEWIEPERLPLRPWVYGRFWQRGCFGLILAPGATGKTAMLAGHALALATGRPLLGPPVWDGPKRVWMWNLEDSKDEIRRLVQAAAKFHGITRAEIDGRLFLNSGLDGEGLIIAETTGQGATLRRPQIEALVAELKRLKIDVLMVDPFVSCHSVPENDNSAIDLVAKEWARVATAANCAVVLAHHTTKLGDGPATAERSRGASALVNAARSAVTLNRMSEKEAQDFEVPVSDAGRYIKAFDDKANRAPRGRQVDWFYLKSVPLQNGGMGGILPGDEIQVMVPWQPPSVAAGLPEIDLIAVQAAVAAGDWRESDQSPDWVGTAIASALEIDLQRVGAEKRIKTWIKQWIRDGWLRVEEAKDRTGRVRPFVRVGKPIAPSPPPLH
jgi:hypothetical protein